MTEWGQIIKKTRLQERGASPNKESREKRKLQVEQNQFTVKLFPHQKIATQIQQKSLKQAIKFPQSSHRKIVILYP